MNSVTVQSIDFADRNQRKQFINVPWPLYADDPMWRPPIRLERYLHLGAQTNPAFEHLDLAAWLAWRDGQPVGRITAQIDSIRAQIQPDSVGYFGMLEAPDDAAVFKQLTATAENWLAERGVDKIQGPFNLTINDECGLLVDGFDTPPAMMMGHARPYYAERLEALGYYGTKDMLAYWIDMAFEHPRAMQRVVSRYAERIRVRPIDRKRFADEFDLIRDLFNDAWAENWGFVPITQAEFQDLGNTLKHLIAHDLVQIAELDGQPAAFIVGLPNLNEAARDIDGRLLPTGIFKLIWRLKIGFPSTSRIPLMGVRRAFQGGILGAALAYAVIGKLQQRLLDHGATGCELSWILDDNRGMREIIEGLGASAYKTYRVYEKQLTP
ncbi:N-acetyltransferase [Salinisphaera sp. USBA-960]|uniref:N-acetyltransferase n=1 Tax=Salinisphaera orenii TaxID=856731 RepID=UPI000DBE8DAC|nr:N-acetyltransferase [Salifodinibacter halophilus]NNC26749.1 N-acetyltransferase [Salifodinibacter halophilus]